MAARKPMAKCVGRSLHEARATAGGYSGICQLKVKHPGPKPPLSEHIRQLKPQENSEDGPLAYESPGVRLITFLPLGFLPR